MAEDVLLETMKPEGSGAILYKCTEKKLMIVYPTKISFSHESKIKTFSDESKPRDLLPTVLFSKNCYKKSLKQKRNKWRKLGTLKMNRV